MGLETIALCVTLPVCAFFIVRWFFQKDTEKEARRRQAAECAGELKAWGLSWAPKLLSDYSVGDYAQLIFDLKQMVSLFIGKGGNAHILAELEGTFKRVLDIKLATKDGRDFVTAELAAVTAKGTS